ncbi:SCO family protein [Rubripirellula reticaptiva]|nr:SCO family protein [Rubripirellula reticaptiva]
MTTTKRNLPIQHAGRRSNSGVLAVIAVIMTSMVALPVSAIAQGLQNGAEVSLNNGVPREVANVTVEQNLGARIPLNLPLTDSNGRKVKTGHYIDGNKPTIISLNYSNCPMLCSVQLNQLTKSLNELDLQIGQDFQLLSVSIDPKEKPETSLKTKQKYVEQLRKSQPGAAQGWEFCTAQQPIITKLAEILGFKYTYDSKSGEYYHPAMLAFVSPKGIVTRYSLAVAFEPEDLRKAIIEAGDGTVGTPVDQFVLWCFSYDPDSNSYVPQAWKIMRLSGAATVGLMIACLTPYWIGRKGRNHPQDSDDLAESPPSPPTPSA